MDRRDNGFLFTDAKGKDNQKKALQKIREEKEQIKVSKIKEDKAFVVQRYLRGYQSRMTLRKKYEAELIKTLADLDKLSQIVLQAKNQIFYLPLKNLYSILRMFNVMIQLRRLPKSKRKPSAYIDIVFGLCKWIQRSLEKPEQNLIFTLYNLADAQDNLKMSGLHNFEVFIRHIVEKLPVDNKSGTLMSCMLAIMKAKEQLKSNEQEFFDMMLGQIHLEQNLLEKIRQWIMSRIELHIAHDSISSEKKNLLNTAVKTALTIISKFVTTERTYDISVSMQHAFVHEIWSIPTINKYIMPLLQQPDYQLNYRNIFQSYYFSKKLDMNEEEKEESKKDMQGNLIGELQKNERKMFIFANLFEIMHVKLINEMNTFEIYPVFQVLESNVQHLSRRIFDTENASIDDYIMITILRNQLLLILDFKTTSKIFGHIFGESVNSKHSIFEDHFNPQAAISLTKIYSTILMIARQTQKVFQQIILGIAFNEPVLYKLWRFIDVYCGIDSLLVRNVREYDQYNSFIHSLSLFCLAFTRNLWVTSFEEFLKNQYFERKDIIGMVQLLKALIVDLILEGNQKANLLDEFVLYASGILLRLLHEQFAIKDYIDPKAWDITEIKWKDILETQNFPPQVKKVISYMPECIPFDVRATLFTQMIKNDVSKNQYIQKTQVRIRRSQLFQDGYQAFMKVNNLKSIVGVVFINELGMQEDGHDAGGLFKEFLVNLAQIVFNPHYGLFLITEIEKELYPNAQSHILFGKNDTNYFLFLGRLLGKAMYEGITLEPKFADFFLRRLIGKQNSLNDLKSLDPELYKQMTMMRNYDGNVEDLMLTFSVTDENEVTGERREVDLIPNGSQICVNNQNKFRYIYMVADFRLNRRIKAQTDAFIKGFHEVIPLQWLQIFNEREMQMLISGAQQKIDIQDLKKYTKYMGGYSASNSTIKMFWNVVEKEMNDDDQSKLLKFVTSCPRQPLMGFKQLHPTFTISFMDGDQPNEKLPTASTCFNILRLPPYSNAKILKEKVMYAIHSNAGFELA